MSGIDSEDTQISLLRVDSSSEELLESRRKQPKFAIVPVGYSQFSGELQKFRTVGQYPATT